MIERVGGTGGGDGDAFAAEIIAFQNGKVFAAFQDEKTVLEAPDASGLAIAISVAAPCDEITRAIRRPVPCARRDDAFGFVPIDQEDHVDHAVRGQRPMGHHRGQPINVAAGGAAVIGAVIVGRVRMIERAEQRIIMAVYGVAISGDEMLKRGAIQHLVYGHRMGGEGAARGWAVIRHQSRPPR